MLYKVIILDTISGGSFPARRRNYGNQYAEEAVSSEALQVIAILTLLLAVDYSVVTVHLDPVYNMTVFNEIPD